jgi:cobalamin synthase
MVFKQYTAFFSNETKASRKAVRWSTPAPGAPMVAKEGRRQAASFPAMGDIIGMQSTLILMHVSKAINVGSLKIRT